MADPTELLVYFLVVSLIGVVDMYSTVGFGSLGSPPWLAKVCATAIGLILNFSARRFIVFPEAPNPDWKPQDPKQAEAVVCVTEASVSSRIRLITD
jgi:putative flippase GtrA